MVFGASRNNRRSDTGPNGAQHVSQAFQPVLKPRCLLRSHGPQQFTFSVTQTSGMCRLFQPVWAGDSVRVPQPDGVGRFFKR